MVGAARGLAVGDRKRKSTGHGGSGVAGLCGKTLVCACMRVCVCACACVCDRIQPPGKGLTRSRQGVLARTSSVYLQGNRSVWWEGL